MSKRKSKIIATLLKEEQNGALAIKFQEWAEKNGCDSEHDEDWRAWWNCFLAGASAWGKILSANL